MKKRRCLFKKYIQPHTEIISDKEVRFGPMYQKEFEIEGLFHQWGLDCLGDDEGFSNFTVAIVETSDGLVHKVEPSNLKFI